MARIWHDKSGAKRRRRWRVAWLHQGRTRSAAFASRDEARRYAAWAQTVELAGKYGSPAADGPEMSPTLAEAIEAYMAGHARTHAPGTTVLERSILTGWAEHAKAGAVHLLVPADVEAHLATLRSRGTQQRHLATIRGFCRWAVEQDHLVDDPCRRVKVVRGERRPARWLTADEYRQLLDACDDDLRDVVVVLANTGLRIGELLSRTWADVHGGRLMVTQTKGKRFRMVGLNAETLEVLNRRLRPSGPIFPGYAIDTLYRRIRRTAERIGLGRVGLHTLRHTFGSHLAMAGVPLKLIAEVMGHRSVSTTERYYAHIAPETAADVVHDLPLGKPFLASTSASHLSTASRRNRSRA